MNTTKTTSKSAKKFSGDKSKNDNKDNNDKGIDNDMDAPLLPAEVWMNDEHDEKNFKASQEVLR